MGRRTAISSAADVVMEEKLEIRESKSKPRVRNTCSKGKPKARGIETPLYIASCNAEACEPIPEPDSLSGRGVLVVELGASSGEITASMGPRFPGCAGEKNTKTGRAPNQATDTPVARLNAKATPYFPPGMASREKLISQPNDPYGLPSIGDSLEDNSTNNKFFNSAIGLNLAKNLNNAGMEHSQQIPLDANLGEGNNLSMERPAKINPIGNDTSSPSRETGPRKAWFGLFFNKNSMSKALTYYPLDLDEAITPPVEELMEGCSLWPNTLVGYVVEKCPYYEYLKFNLNKAWKVKGTVEFHSMDNDFSLFKFSCSEEMSRILKRGP